MERWLEHFANAIFLRSSDTAHDLKTPLNIAVLNLELLRMRLRKLTGDSEDEKLNDYARAIETELRRMARIFDTFFVLCTPPRGEAAPQSFDVAPLVEEIAAEDGFAKKVPPSTVSAHEARIRQAIRMFFDGASRVLAADGRQLDVERKDSELQVTLSGRAGEEDFEPTKLFKFYFTDAQGNPDVSLAGARLIVETYGGELNAIMESDKVWLRLTLPLG
ncbi:MAG TPA: histidine kinase dimerization/phospho-acceptor domain-containing protein [Thermoanaerobaculia bacterium]